MFFQKKPDTVEYPESVQIETTSRCNGRCVFCCHSKMKRPLTDMSDDFFLKVIRDVKELRVKSLNPFVNGEPFMDRKIQDRLALINRELPDVKIVIYTNGALLNEEKTQELSAIRNIDIVNFSLNGIDAEDYKKRVGLDFDKTVANIRNVLRLNRERPFVREVVVASVEYGKEDKAGDKAYNDAFTRFCHENFPGAGVKIGYKYNWISRVFSSRRFRDIPEEDLTIYSTVSGIKPWWSWRMDWFRCVAWIWRGNSFSATPMSVRSWIFTTGRWPGNTVGIENRI